VFTGCNSFTGEKKKMPDSMNIYIPPCKKFIKVDTKKIIDTSACLFFWDIPDIISIKIDDTLGKYVYSLENYLNLNPNNFSELKIIGYPSKNHPIISEFVYVLPSNVYLHTNNYFITPEYDSIIPKDDKINYHLYSDKIIIDSTMGGYSGAPVFIINGHKVELIGIIAGWGETDIGHKHFLFVVKIGYA